MSDRRLTRYQSQLSNNGRKHSERSSEESESPSILKKQRKHKSAKMNSNSNNNENTDMMQLLNTINNNTTITQADIKVLTGKVNDLGVSVAAINRDISQIKSDLELSKQQITESKKQLEQHDKVLESIVAASNKQEQLALDDQVSITNLPLEINEKSLLQCLSSWSKQALDEKMVRRVSLIVARDRKSKMAFMTFWNDQAKFHFMDSVKQKLKDANGKHIPILTDHVFGEFLRIDHEHRATPIYFRTPMSKHNQALFNFIRANTPKGKVMTFISGGVLNVRVGGREGKAEQVATMKQAESFIHRASL
jgi:hypothetical protein